MLKEKLYRELCMEKKNSFSIFIKLRILYQEKHRAYLNVDLDFFSF